MKKNKENDPIVIRNIEPQLNRKLLIHYLIILKKIKVIQFLKLCPICGESDGQISIQKSLLR